MESGAFGDDFGAFRLSKFKGVNKCVLCPCPSGEEAQVNTSINFAFFEPRYFGLAKTLVLVFP